MPSVLFLKPGNITAAHTHTRILLCNSRPGFRLKSIYIIKEFQRLKADEQKQIGWTVKRELAKINYCIHTDAIKVNIIIPLEITREQASFVYASEADVLNVALFGVPQTLLKRKSIVAFSPCFLTWLQR